MGQYFEMNDNVHVPGRWFLGDAIDRSGRKLQWIFMQGKPVQIDAPLRIPFSDHIERGRPIDYSEFAAEIVPVVHVRVARVLAEVAPADIQIIPVEIEGQSDQFCIVNVVRVVKCIDDAACGCVELFTSTDDEVFADRVGTYKGILKLRIDKSKVGDEKIFRLWGYSVAIIVTEEVKAALEAIGTEGVRFTEV